MKSNMVSLYLRIKEIDLDRLFRSQQSFKASYNDTNQELNNKR